MGKGSRVQENKEKPSSMLEMEAITLHRFTLASIHHEKLAHEFSYLASREDGHARNGIYESFKLV